MDYSLPNLSMGKFSYRRLGELEYEIFQILFNILNNAIYWIYWFPVKFHILEIVTKEQKLYKDI